MINDDRNILDILTLHATEKPNQVAYFFLEDGSNIKQTLTYLQLQNKAKQIASYLQLIACRGERAILLYPSGLEFITAFFACLYARIIAVPAYPPRPNRSLNRIKSIVNNAQPKVLLTTESILSNLEKRITEIEQLKTLHRCATDNLENYFGNYEQKTIIENKDIAFLQYTSGSTGNPRGVIISHGNLLDNQKMIQQAFGHHDHTIGIGWLPLYHDMGLIGNILQPLYLGFPFYFMSPLTFLHRPLRWLQAISKYQCTSSGAPNFAYDLCLQRIKPEQRDELDLSSWTVAFNGAERVRTETLQSFANYFHPCGFREEAFYPCYGLAEATLFVTGGKKDQKPLVANLESSALQQNHVIHVNTLDSQQIVSCGEPWLGSKVIITNPDTLTQLSENKIGEIWVQSNSVAQGYWQCAEETQRTFHGCLTNKPENPFMRTGDLGFIQDGQLFVTGRLKDIIIIDGRNYYPQDVELTISNSHPSLKSCWGAAFTVEIENEEKLVCIQEVKRTHQRNLNVDETSKNIRQAVIQEHELQIYRLVLVKTGIIPRTSSGKVQRYLCQQKFIDGSLKPYFH